MQKHRKLYITILAVIVLISVAALLGDRLLSQFVQNKFDTVDFKQYQKTYSKLHVSIANRKITVSDFTLTDTLNQNKLTVKKLEIKSIHIFKLLFKKSIHIGALELNRPSIELFSTKSSLAKAEEESSSKAELPAITIGKIRIRNGQLLYTNRELKQDSTAYCSFDIGVENIHTISDKKFPLEFGELELKATKAFFKTSDNDFKFRLAEVQYNSGTEKLQLRNFECQPLKSRYELAKMKGYAKEWHQFKIAGITANGLAIDKVLQNKQLVLQSILLQDAEADIFKDKRWPRKQKPDTKLLADLLQLPPTTYYCDTIALKNVRISYAERTPDSKEEGKISFSKLNATMLQATNHDSLKHKPIQMHAEAMVQNVAPISVDFTFTKPSSSEQHRISGKLSNMPCSAFNSITQPNMNLHLKQGTIKRIDFNFYYTNSHSNGDLNFVYDDLKVELLKPENGKTNGIKTLLVNSLLVHSQNSPEKKSYRKGTIDFERDKKRSFLNFWWKSVLSGIKSVVLV